MYLLVPDRGQKGWTETRPGRGIDWENWGTGCWGPHTNTSQDGEGPEGGITHTHTHDTQTYIILTQLHGKGPIFDGYAKYGGCVTHPATTDYSLGAQLWFCYVPP